MNEREFAEKKHAEWDRLAELINRANSASGLRTLTREELLSLGPLYRRASSDLAHARRHAISVDLIEHLNSLVSKAHAILYEAETSTRPLQTLVDFYLYEFPTILQKRWRAFMAAVLISIFGAVTAYAIVIQHPESSDLFISAEFKESLNQWKSKKVEEQAHLEQSGFLMTHNLSVGLTSFALGIALIPDISLMYTNGTMLGAFSAAMTQVHAHATFWPGILPHGIAELTALFICGGAGFVLSSALLLPAPYTRIEALKLAALDAVKMVLGTIPLFIFAGMIEGMFSHQATPAWFRYTFAGLNGIAWYLYLFLPRRKLDAVSTVARPRNLKPA